MRFRRFRPLIPGPSPRSTGEKGASLHSYTDVSLQVAQASTAKTFPSGQAGDEGHSRVQNSLLFSEANPFATEATQSALIRVRATERDELPDGTKLFPDKNHSLAEYALAGMDNQLFIAKYQLALPKKEDMQRFIDEQLEALETKE